MKCNVCGNYYTSPNLGGSGICPMCDCYGCCKRCKILLEDNKRLRGLLTKEDTLSTPTGEKYIKRENLEKAIERSRGNDYHNIGIGSLDYHEKLAVDCYIETLKHRLKLSTPTGGKRE